MLELPQLAFTGKRFQDVRTALNKAAKAGITAEWLQFRHAPLALTDQIRAISEEWVADKGLPEMGFTLGGLDELARRRRPLPRRRRRRPHGARRDELAPGAPRRRRDRLDAGLHAAPGRGTGGFHGVMEFLIASAALRCKAEGAELLSLSGAPLARHDRGSPTPSAEAARRRGPAAGAGVRVRVAAGVQGEVRPVYRPLYLLYDDPVALPAVAGAIARAYLPQLDARQGTRLARRLLHVTGRPTVADRPLGCTT